MPFLFLFFLLRDCEGARTCTSPPPPPPGLPCLESLPRTGVCTAQSIFRHSFPAGLSRANQRRGKRKATRGEIHVVFGRGAAGSDPVIVRREDLRQVSRRARTAGQAAREFACFLPWCPCWLSTIQTKPNQRNTTQHNAAASSRHTRHSEFCHHPSSNSGNIKRLECIAGQGGQCSW